MLTLIKLVQSIVKALNSDGTPEQVAAGVALGSALGLTPLLSLHNLGVATAIALLNVSVPGAMLGWLIFTPIGFLLDPAFDAIGRGLLLEVPGLTGLWAWSANAPILALGNLNNSIVLGSLIGWIVLGLPIYGAARVGVTEYRARVFPILQRSKVFQVVQASKLYNLYQLFRP